jgi:hypothetical protein
MQQFASVAVKVRSGATAEGRDRTHLFPLCAASCHSWNRDRTAEVSPNKPVFVPPASATTALCLIQ